MTPDVNVLVAAALPDHGHHGAALRWLNESMAEASPMRPLTLLPVVAAGFVRVAANRRIFARPLPVAEAVTAIRSLLAFPYTRLAAHHGEIGRLLEQCEVHAPTGSAVTDAWIAATVLELDEHLVTFDRGFRRFLRPRHLTVLEP